ncbi:MAG: TIR domain-containing protein [Pseudomonadota bacterium]
MTTKDLFISYGRRESLGFVGRLHQQLKLAGYDGWFDKVNIPDGDDYAQRINQGIESAHNFVYVMAPRCLTSPYCLIELEYARILGKRVIPINQMVIFNTPNKELSDGDKQVLVGFYKFHNLPDPNIQTTQDVLERSIAVVGSTDWLAAKEEVSDEACNNLFVWAESYENNWAKHDDLEYLETFELPKFGEAVNELAGVVESIKAVVERQKEYVHKHTEILTNALNWQQNQKATQRLLVGKERTAAEEWLLTDFLPPKQPPCVPSALVCEFICEARKNAENMMTDIFICYDTEDKKIRDNVIRSLSNHAKTTWTHDRDIQKGDNYECSIEQGIESADNFFYFISPRSVVSEYCQKELNHALKYNKRIVPLLIAETPEANIPESVRYLQYVDFTDNTCQADYDSDIDDILNILRHEQEYYKQHKILLVRALKWQTENYKSSFLLRGHNLDNAKTWLRLNDKRDKHLPLDLHHKLIIDSEAAKGQLGTEVFVSYSRKDADFARQLNTSLQEAGKTTWFDQESISTGVDFEKEIYKGIDGADNFVFVISPDAVNSEYCEREVNYASEQNKRFISILHREIIPEKMPDALRKINWIDFKDTEFDKSFPELIQTIELDREHAHLHTVLQQRAGDWAENNKSGDFLLNITACENAESWRDKAMAEKKQPALTELQDGFIGKSREAIQKANRRKNILFSFVGLLAIFAVIVAGIAYVKMAEAEKNEIVALRISTEANFALGKQFEALLSGLTAAKKLQNADESLQRKVVTALQKPVYWIKEKYRINMETRSVSFSYYDKIIAIPAENDTIKLWDFDGNLVAILSDNAGLKPYTQYFIYEGKIITANTKDKQKKFWRVDDGSVIFTLKDVVSVKFSPNEQIVATITENKQVKLWQVTDGTSIPVPPDVENIKSIRFSHDNNMIATLNDDKIKLWQVGNESSITLASNQDKFDSVLFSHDDQTIITKTEEKQIIFWQIDGTPIITLPDEEIEEIALSPRTPLLATLSEKQVKLWDLKGNLLRTLKDEAGLSSVRFNPKDSKSQDTDDREILLTLTETDKVILWQPDGTIINTLTDAKGLSSISFSPKKQIIITGTKDDRQKLWQLNGNFIAETRGWQQFFNHDEQLIAIQAVDDDKIIKLYQRDGTLITTLKGHQDYIGEVIFHPTKSILATGSRDNTIKIWHTDGILLDTLAGHGDWINNLKFSTNGQKLISTSDDLTLKIWQLDNQLLKVFRSDSTIFYSDKEHAKNFITAIKDGPVKLWKANGKTIKKLMLSSQGQVQAEFSDKGQFFVTWLEKGQNHTAPLKLWRTEDGHLIKTLITEIQEKISINFLAEDKFIITTVQGDNSYGPVKLWRTEDGQLIQTLIQKTACKDGQVRVNTSGQILVTTITCKNIYGPVQLWKMDGTAQTLITAIESDENISGNVFVSDKWIATMPKGEEFYGPLQLWNSDGTLVNTLIAKIQKEKGDSIGFSVIFNDKTQALVTKITGTINDEYFYGPVQLWQNGISVTTLIEQIKNQDRMRGVESFSSDGKLLVTGVKDGPTKLWNSETGKLLKILIDKNIEHPRIAFSHDDKMVVASYNDGPIVLWRVTDNRYWA